MKVNKELLDKVKGGEEITMWFPYKEDETSQVLLRYMPPLEWEKLRKKCGKKKIDSRGEWWDIKDDRFKLVYADTVIKDWKGFTLDETNEDFPCTPENKRLLLDSDAEFAEWVFEKCRELENFLQRKGEQNLTTLESGENTG